MPFARNCATSSSPTATVLIVDDDADIRETLSLTLESSGYRTLTAANGEEALRVLRSSDAPPAVILLDLMMPGMNGWRFREEQVRDEALAGIPVVILSGAGDVAQKAAERGAAGCLEKPPGLDAVRSMLQRYSGPVC